MLETMENLANTSQKLAFYIFVFVDSKIKSPLPPDLLEVGAKNSDGTILFT
jgi:hypothetical protein